MKPWHINIHVIDGAAISKIRILQRKTRRNLILAYANFHYNQHVCNNSAKCEVLFVNTTPAAESEMLEKLNDLLPIIVPSTRRTDYITQHCRFPNSLPKRRAVKTLYKRVT